MNDILRRLREPPFGTETSERNLMVAAADEIEQQRGAAAFLNKLRSLFNINGYLLPELTDEQQLAFVRDPVRYFIGTDKAQQGAIFREVAKRQRA